MATEQEKTRLRAAYKNEYIAKTPLNLREKFLLWTAAPLLASCPWLGATGALTSAMGIVAGTIAGVAAAPFLFVSAVAAATVGGILVWAGMRSNRTRANQALEQDIDSGKLVARFEKEMLRKLQSAPRPAPALVALGAKADFGAASEAAAAGPAVVPQPGPAGPQKCPIPSGAFLRNANMLGTDGLD